MRHASTIIERVRQLAEENPNAFYKHPTGTAQCYYDAGTAAGHTGCIMGQAIRGYISLPKPQYRGSISALLAASPNVEASKSEVEWLLIVQEQQDRGISWRGAVAHADKIMRLVG